MTNHPEADQYELYMDYLQMQFHESKRLAEEGEKKTALVDIDETICFYPQKRTYNLAEPHQENINKINRLYDEGWHIIYWTARGGSQPDNIGRLDKYKALTISQLDKWGCKYHDVQLGNKPMFDLFIDDKAKRIEEI